MGDILSTPSQPNPNSSSAMSPANTPQSHQSKPSFTEPKLSIQESSDAQSREQAAAVPEKTPIEESPNQFYTKTAATDENSAEKENPTETDLASSIDAGNDDDDEEEEEEEEEEGECGFCLFMKAGGCKEIFIEWERCVEEGERNKEDIVEKCFQQTAALKKCMEAHSDYYAPILQAEKIAEEEAMKQLEEEKLKPINNQEEDGNELGNQEKEENLGGS